MLIIKLMVSVLIILLVVILLCYYFFFAHCNVAVAELLNILLVAMLLRY